MVACVGCYYKLKSVAHIISLTSNDRYAPFLKKPAVIANDVCASENDEMMSLFLEKMKIMTRNLSIKGS